MFAWITWQFALGSTVQEWLDDEELTGAAPASSRRSRRPSRSRCSSTPSTSAAPIAGGVVSLALGPGSAPGSQEPGRHHRRARPGGCASRPSSTSGCGSPASCTTWWPTTSRRWASRPAPRDGCSTATPTPRARPSPTSRRPPATRSPRCGACSARSGRASGPGTRGTHDRGRCRRPAAPRRRGRPAQGLAVTPRRGRGRRPDAATPASARPRPRRLPHRAGGPHQRAPALHRRRRLGRRPGRRVAPHAVRRGGGASTTAARATARPAAGWASSASASGPPPTTARSTSAHGSPAATGCACATRWERRS